MKMRSVQGSKCTLQERRYLQMHLKKAAYYAPSKHYVNRNLNVEQWTATCHGSRWSKKCFIAFERFSCPCPFLPIIAMWQ